MYSSSALGPRPIALSNHGGNHISPLSERNQSDDMVIHTVVRESCGVCYCK